MKCKDCKFYVKLDDDELVDFGDGECYRYPKTSSNMQETTGTESELFVYPIVHGEYDWCGEFKSV